MKIDLDEKTGDLYTPDGQYLGSLGEILPKSDDDNLAPVNNEDFDGDEDEDDDSPKSYHPGKGLSETLIKSNTTFELPKSKKKIENALWAMFKGGIHQAMTNTCTPKQKKRLTELMHYSIISSMSDRDVAKAMLIPDYIQLHIYAENLIARSVTYEGDGLRDATLLGRNLDPNVVDALRYTPDKQKNGGGFFGFLKR